MNYKKQKPVPKLETFLELNKKFGYGYQAHMVMAGISDSVLDSEPLPLDEIYSYTVSAIEEINRQTGYGYEPHKIIHITDEALRANRRRDFTSAKVLRDIEQDQGELAVPVGTDYITEMINGKEEVLLSGRGVVLMAFFSWRDEKTPKSREALRRYCQYLAAHRYGGSASDIWAELESKDKDSGADWIKGSYSRYVEDDRAVIEYMLG